MKVDKRHLPTNARKWQVSVTQFVRSRLLLLRAWNILSSRFVLYSLYILTGHYAMNSTAQEYVFTCQVQFQTSDKFAMNRYSHVPNSFGTSICPDVSTQELRIFMKSDIRNFIKICRQFEFYLITIIVTRPACISVHISTWGNCGFPVSITKIWQMMHVYYEEWSTVRFLTLQNITVSHYNLKCTLLIPVNYCCPAVPW